MRTRFNMYPSITINGSARGNISSGKAINTMEEISNKILPSDMGFAWSGTSLQEKESSGQIGPIIVMSLVLYIYFLSDYMKAGFFLLRFFLLHQLPLVVLYSFSMFLGLLLIFILRLDLSCSLG